MPTLYKCKNCSLYVEAGWYHFHDFSDGYGAATLLFCNECGTNFQVLHPAPQIEEKYLYLYSLKLETICKDKIQVMKILRKINNCNLEEVKRLIEELPIFVKKNVSLDEINSIIDEFKDTNAKFAIIKESKYQEQIPLVKEVLKTKNGPIFSEDEFYSQDYIEYSIENEKIRNFDFNCYHCNSVNNYSFEIKEDIIDCPSCKNHCLEYNKGWIT